MPTEGPFPINRGWISDSDFLNCPPGGALTFSGFQPWANGSIKTIDGYSTFSNFRVTGNTSILGFTSWQDSAQIGAQSPTLVVATNGKIYTSPFNAISFTDRTGATAPSNVGIYCFDSLNGKLLLFNSGGAFTTVPLKLSAYNGNVANLGGTPPIGDCIKVINNFAFVGRVLAASSTASNVYWSNVGDPETWTAANFATFRPNDGDFVSCLSAIGSNLIIFKQRSMGVLSTLSTALSGSVTLGPLSQITDRIGATSPTAADQMPDGTIVFLAMDRCLYQTDGASIANLANIPSPNSNYAYSVNFILTNPPLLNSYSEVKVDPLFHRIFIRMANTSGAASQLYVFDYLHRAWCDWSELSTDLNTGTGTGGITSLSYVENQVANSYGLAKSVWLGSETGYLQTFNPFSSFQKNSLSATWPCIFETSFVLGGDRPPTFIPRTVLIPFRQTNITGVACTVAVGWDGTYQTPVSYTVNAARGVLSIPIAETPNSGTGLQPRSLQIKITLTGNTSGGQTIIEPLYLSDERIQ